MVTQVREGNSPKDPLIDEVRANRQALVESCGNDLALLAERLRKIQTDYENRAGDFAGLPREEKDEIFPQENQTTSDPLLDELHQMRASKP